VKYIPLDEMLSRPRIRALRALYRHADWVSSPDLYDACDVSEVPVERKTFASALNVLIRANDIERRAVRTGLMDGERSRTIGQYRITNGGRASLRASIESANPHPSEFLS